MPILYKLKHLPATLAFFQKGSWPDDSLEKETKQLEALLHTYDQINPLRDLDTVLSNGYRKEDFLANLTYIAEDPDHPHAGRACYILGCIYMRSGAPYNECYVSFSSGKAAYFFGQALRKGYTNASARLAYAEAAAYQGWYDTALRWLPRESAQYKLASTYLTHMIRLCAENQVTFPAADADGIVTVTPQNSMQKLKTLLMPDNLIEKRKTFCRQVDELEKAIPSAVLTLSASLDAEEQKLRKRKKQSARKWWLFCILLLLITLPGFLSGNGEGTQKLFYGIFVTLCDSSSYPYLEGMSFAEKLASTLDAEARSTLYGNRAATFVIGALALNILNRIFSPKYARQYNAIKAKLNQDHRLSQRLKGSPALSYKDPMDVSMLKQKGYRSLNDLAQRYHTALSPDQSLPSLPSLSRYSSTDTAEQTIPLQQDFHAFASALRMVHASGQNILPWSATDLAKCYRNLKDYEEQPFARYFSTMFEDTAREAEQQGDTITANHLIGENVKLMKAIRLKEDGQIASFRAEHTPIERTEHTTYRSFASDHDEEKEKSFNLWTNGTYATNQEMLWEMHEKGEISDDQYGKLMFSHDRLRVESEDDGC